MELAGGKDGATKAFTGALALVPRRALGVAVLVAVLWLALIALSAGRAVAEQGLASWYGPGFEGQPTASGEPFDKHDFTCAHKTLPFGTVLNVAYEGRSTQCRVNDRGPYSGNRELDLSQGTAEYLGLDEVGVDVVGYSVAGGGAPDEVPHGASAQSKNVVFSETPENAKSPGAGEYVVRPGDTLSEIADALGTSSDVLASFNGIADPDILLEGQVLQTPETRGGPHTSQPTEPPSGDASDASVTKGVAGTVGAEPVGEKVRAEATFDEDAPTGAASDPGSAVIDNASTYLGVPYVLGGEDPSAGLDCSAFTSLAYRDFGISLPRTAAAQYGYGAPVSGAPAAGDLLFWSEDGTSITHVGLAVGDGNVIHASSYYMQVTTTPMDHIPGYVGARRVI